ncbi:STAS domain-containing protein [Actinomadura gamaensis]|uniref:Anti-sigma factor antagonist n=1 Tax=Actinomadura gamaensis TaxID=1763541 RepID=A0ABV9TZJ4_9ACTN
MSGGAFRDLPDPAGGAGGRRDGADPRARVEVERRDGCTVARVEGEIDYRTAPGVRESLLQAVRDDRPRCMVVDLDRVDFFDSSGLGTLVAVWKAAQLQGGRLVIARATGRCRHVLKITGVDRRIPVVETLPEALAHATLPPPDPDSSAAEGPPEPVR